ncbi:MAG: NUDIX domain-containing protein [Bacteroidales bacterium]|nr:NUDIX domain-containing protein [Bacteroidales bacterium]
MNTKHPCFNVRVYGIIVNDKGEVLLADEYQLDTKMTKFPGGGLQFGEGTKDCLRREAIEEFGQGIEVLEHYYTLDYYQPSYFYKNCQLLSIYYKAWFADPVRFVISDRPFDFPRWENGSLSFRWISKDQLSPDEVSLPVDKVVASKLQQEG